MACSQSALIFATSPFQIATACIGLQFGFERGLEAVLETVHPFHVGASVISLAPTFLQKSERAHFAAPPFQIATACAGLRFGFGIESAGCQKNPGIRFANTPKSEHKKHGFNTVLRYGNAS